jgi:hypothetical protein
MTILYNTYSIISWFKNYLKETTLKRFSSYKNNTLIYGFEGNHHYFRNNPNIKFFHRFLYDIENDKYSLYYVKVFESVETIKEDVSLIEIINSYNEHNNSIFNIGNYAVSYER